MFYTEEDVQPAVNEAVNLFGPVGNIMQGDVLNDVSIATREYGKLWYGDVEKSTLKEKCNTLRQKIQQEVYVLNTEFEFTDYNRVSYAP